MLISSRRLLESIREKLDDVLLPEPPSANSVDIAGRMKSLLTEVVFREEGGRQLLAEKILEGHALAQRWMKHFKTTEPDMQPLTMAIDLFRSDLSADSAFSVLRKECAAIALVLDRQVEIGRAGSRTQGVGTTYSGDFAAEAARWELSLVLRPAEARTVSPRAATIHPAFTPEAFRTYLDARFPEAAPHRVTKVSALPGGYSKTTMQVDFITQAGVVERTAIRLNQFVMPDSGACFLLEREFALLQILHRAGYMVPRPLWFESSEREFGGAFSALEFVPGIIRGSVSGSAAGISESCLKALAAAIAKLHLLDTSSIASRLNAIFGPNAAAQSRAERNRIIVKSNHEFWMKLRNSASPACQRAFGWLFEHVPNDPRPPVLIHGDMGFHNVLFAGDEVSAVLDWETAQLGDPAADLGPLRAMIEPHIAWTRFMEFYRDAGGLAVSEESLRYHAVAVWLKNAFRTEISSGLFESGIRDNIKLATLSTTLLGIFLQNVEDQIERAGVKVDSRAAEVGRLEREGRMANE